VETALHQRLLAPLALSGTYPFSLETVNQYATVAEMMTARDG
jgi:hypothetical protein